nr:PREDICTED: kinesin-like protein KIF27 [Lepisosteus oculatus]XP_015219438.1 PREDICTED: kinesin-like protein KIF27 [Lepisosteus oculatus]
MEEIPVKVAVRIRPLLPKEILHNHQVCVRVVPNTQQIIIGKDRAFTFDFVFGQRSLQDEVYTTCIKPLVLSLIEGYNVTVFAYGQTGSGKTYTIGGGHIVATSDEENGIIPRAIQEIFHNIAEKHNTDFTVKVSYIEVYKEELRDLLELETSSKDMHIREDEKGNTVIVGAKESLVETAEDVMSLLEAGTAARHTGTTQMNEHSSRSHAILTITVSQQGPTRETAQQSRGEGEPGTHNSVQLISSKFHFVDLAGSERVTKTGNTGERFKESIQINSGLLALGNVISALGDPKRKSQHVPYRDAKITRILKDSLGGNAKTVMITCISPSSSDLDESLNSLKYANRARNIKNKPIVNYNPDWDRMDEMELEIRALREALQNQHASLMTRGSHISQELPGGHESSRIRVLEEQLAQLQVESYHYRACTEDAMQLLLELRETADLPATHERKLKEWLEGAEELQSEKCNSVEVECRATSTGEEPHHITILQLKRELKKCQDALATDEDVFVKKESELKRLQDQINTLMQENEEYLAALEDERNKSRLQNERMVEQQLLIDRLREDLQSFKLDKSDVSVERSASSRRPFSVPLTNYNQAGSRGDASQSQLRQDTRKVHTSPPAYSLERVMAAFRTRSQLLLAQIEEQDEVLCCEFSDGSEEEKNAKKDRENDKKQAFRRSMNRTWTRKQTPVVSDSNVHDEESLHTQPFAEHGAAGLPELLVEEERVRCSQTLNLQKLKEAELRLTQAKQKTKELAINIRMKEELIKELVKTGKDAQAVNRHYSMKIVQVEQEAEQAKRELKETQQQLQELEAREGQDGTETAQLQRDVSKKVDTAKIKVQVLQKKQQDTKKLASLSAQSEKRLAELEQNVEHMRRQQTLLQKKLREETDKKRKLEAEIIRDQQHIKELQLKTEQQKRILKVKTEEVAAFKRTKHISTPEDEQRLEAQRKWLDEEVEKVLQQRQALTELEEELKKREEIIAKKEAFSQEKSQLEIKKLRSSQAVSKNILKLSAQLSAVDRKLSEKTSQLQSSSAESKRRIFREVEELQQERNQLLKRRDSLDEKLKNGSVLTVEEERLLFQLEEWVEALDAAIEYKNDTIDSRQQSLRTSTEPLISSKEGVMDKLSTLSFIEIKILLFKYFNKVVGLRESERKLQLQCEEMRMHLEEEEGVVRNLESAVERLTLEMDRRLTLQQREHEHKMQLLLQEFREGRGECFVENIKTYEAKIQQLEKDLFFYKKTSRDLKKKLKELVADSLNQQPAFRKGNADGQDKCLVPEDYKWTSVSESSRENRSSKGCSDSPVTSGRSQKISGCWDELEQIANAPSVFQSRQRVTNNEEPSVGYDVPNSAAPQTSKSGIQFPELTPVKVSRRELRQISASDLPVRRFSLGVSATSIQEDSIEAFQSKEDF